MSKSSMLSAPPMSMSGRDSMEPPATGARAPGREPKGDARSNGLLRERCTSARLHTDTRAQRCCEVMLPCACVPVVRRGAAHAQSAEALPYMRCVALGMRSNACSTNQAKHHVPSHWRDTNNGVQVGSKFATSCRHRVHTNRSRASVYTSCSDCLGRMRYKFSVGHERSGSVRNVLCVCNIQSVTARIPLYSALALVRILHVRRRCHPEGANTAWASKHDRSVSFGEIRYKLKAKATTQLIVATRTASAERIQIQHW